MFYKSESSIPHTCPMFDSIKDNLKYFEEDKENFSLSWMKDNVLETLEDIRQNNIALRDIASDQESRAVKAEEKVEELEELIENLKSELSDANSIINENNFNNE